MDNLALPIQMSNAIVLAMVSAIKMNGASCRVIGNVEGSSRVRWMSWGGKLRMLRSS